MKNIIALGLCLATLNIVAEDIENISYQEKTTQEYNSETVIVTDETVVEADTIDSILITLPQVRELLESEEGIEFLVPTGLTPDEAINEIINVLERIYNKTLMIGDNLVDAEGISLIINDQTYFIKADEYMNFNNEVTKDTTSKLDNETSHLEN